MTRALERRTPLGAAEALEFFLEASGALRLSHFKSVRGSLPSHPDGTSCDRCTTGLQDRFSCLLCARGALVAEYEHDGPRVCASHRRWVGPGGTISEQATVGADVLRADRAYQRMKASGDIDAHRLAELEGCVDAWARAERGGSFNAPTRFAIAVRVALAALAPAALERYAALSVESRYHALSKSLERATGSASCAVLVDLVWSLLRPTNAPSAADPHAFPSMEHGAVPHTEQYRTSSYPRALHLHLAQFGGSERAGTRFALATLAHGTHNYECVEGHLFSSTVYSLGNSGPMGGCGYCGRRKALAGFNTLADTHPELASEWDHEANGELGPDQILAGSGMPVHWRCAEQGHPYKATPNSRTTSGSGCGYCSNQLVAPEINALSLTHPRIAAEWHPTRNGTLTPQEVVAGSERRVWWLCPEEGHAYETAPVYRTQNGSGCHYCTRQKANATTCLAATHPDVADRWHEELNGRLTPFDVLAGSTRKAWFICSKGHAYDQAVASHVKGVGCKFCSNYETSPSNCMAEMRPDLAAQFHPTKNAPLTPETVVPGTSRRLWWRCSLGHEWRTTGDNRVRSNTGCPYCSNKKVWAGFNDMATTNPNLAAQFHEAKNAPLRATDVVAGTGKRLWWQCECGKEWRATGDSRFNKGRGCPNCKRCVKG